MFSAPSHLFLAHGPKSVAYDGRLFALQAGERRDGHAVCFDFMAHDQTLDTVTFVVTTVPYSDLLEVEVRFYCEDLRATYAVSRVVLTAAQLSKL